MANTQHPAGLGSFEQYIPVEDRKVGEIFELSEEDKDRWANGRNYERFTVTRIYDENYAVPVRPGIIATYTEDDLGYLIQQTEDGFRYIGVEFGEDDDFGPFVASKKEALRGAVADWRAVGQGDSWAAWSLQMAKDSVAPEVPAIDAQKIEDFIIGSTAGVALTEAQAKELAAGLAEYLSSK